LSEKIRKTKAARVADGAYTGGEANPFGYRRTASGLDVDPKEAALLHDAVRRLYRGDSLYRITAEWNDEGVQTSRGAKWRPKTLRRTLMSDHLVGARGYPRIFTAEEAAIAHTVLEREPVAPVGRPAGRRYPLTGLVVCSECGEKLNAWSGRYRCDKSKGGCGAVSVHAFWLEQYVLDELAQRPEVPATPSEVREIDTEPLLSELQEIKASIAETQALASDGKLRPSDSAPILDGLRERERAVTDELARTLLDAEPRPPLIEVDHPFFPPHPLASILPFGGFTGSTPDAMERWSQHKLTETEVLQLRDEYLAYVDRVTVRKSAQRGKSFDTKRIKVQWKRTSRRRST
jgi:hypothetical protein